VRSREIGAPVIPEALADWMGAFGWDGGPGDPEALAGSGVRALVRSLDHTGGDREGAYTLLAADGLITLAVEALAAKSDLEEGLHHLIVAIVTSADGEEE